MTCNLSPVALSWSQIHLVFTGLINSATQDKEKLHYSNDLHAYLGVVLPEFIEHRWFLRVTSDTETRSGEVLNWEQAIEEIVRFAEDHYRNPKGGYHEVSESALGRKLPEILAAHHREIVV